MKLERLSIAAQSGLRQLCAAIHRDELMLDDFGSSPEHWAWFTFQLQAVPDRPEWFPKGKWATIQFIQTELLFDADAIISAALGEQKGAQV